MKSITSHSNLRSFGWCVALILISIQSWGQEVGCISGNCVDGQGIYTWKSGSQYEGEWRDDQRNGQGAQTYASGNVYVGEWRDGLIHGRGTFTWANGNQYGGEWTRAKINGQGTYIWADGRKYVGAFRNNFLNGQGTMTYANGDEYVGGWRDGERNGQGVLIKTDGSVLRGLWANDISQELAMQTSCTNSGFIPNTDDHAQCVMRLAIAEAAQENSASEREML